MIDSNGQPMSSLFAALHGGGGLPGADPSALDKKRFGKPSAAFHRTAFGTAAVGMEHISLLAPTPPTGCTASTHASSTQVKRLYTVKPEPPPRFIKPTRSALVDASQVKPSPRSAGGPPTLSTANRTRPQSTFDYFQPKPPERRASTPGHEKIVTVRQRNARLRPARPGDGGPPSAADVVEESGAGPDAAAPMSIATAIALGSDVGPPEAAIAAVAEASAAVNAQPASVHLFVVGIDDEGTPLLRIMVRDASEDAAAAEASAVQAVRALVDESLAEDAEAKELAEAKRRLKENEAFFDEMKRQLEAEESAALVLQAGARGRKGRQMSDSKKLFYTGGI